jgi:pyridoxal/pyridoxine/pyridoxamine kinase
LLNFFHVLQGADFLQSVGKYIRTMKAAHTDSSSSSSSGVAKNGSSRKRGRELGSFDYFCDPVLGDNGKLYVPEACVKVYRDELVPLGEMRSLCCT